LIYRSDDYCWQTCHSSHTSLVVAVRVIRPEWKLGDYSECKCGASKCTEAAKVRSVTCVNPLTGATFVDSNCAGPKPDSTLKCQRDDCCGVWAAGTKCANGVMEAVCKLTNGTVVEERLAANTACDASTRPTAAACQGMGSSYSIVLLLVDVLKHVHSC